MTTVFFIVLACLRTSLKIILGLPLKLNYFYSHLVSLCFSFYFTFDSNVSSDFNCDILLSFWIIMPICSVLSFLGHLSLAMWLRIACNSPLVCFSPLWRPVHWIRRGGLVTQLPSQLYSWSDLPLFHNGTKGIW